MLKISVQTILAVLISASSTVAEKRCRGAPHGTADDVVDIEDASGIAGSDATIVQREGEFPARSRTGSAVSRGG